MTEHIEDLQEQTVSPELSAEEIKKEEILSHRRKTALVTYLAILFAVAFLLVALSMLIENKKLQSSNEALEEDKHQTSVTLNGRIESLQNENRELDERRSAAETENARLQQELEAVQASAAAAQESEAARYEVLDKEKQALGTELELQRTKNEDCVRAYELLLQAAAQNEENDLEALAATLAELEPLQELLGPEAKTLLEALAID